MQHIDDDPGALPLDPSWHAMLMQTHSVQALSKIRSTGIRPAMLVHFPCIALGKPACANISINLVSGYCCMEILLVPCELKTTLSRHGPNQTHAKPAGKKCRCAQMDVIRSHLVPTVESDTVLSISMHHVSCMRDTSKHLRNMPPSPKKSQCVL